MSIIQSLRAARAAYAALTPPCYKPSEKSLERAQATLKKFNMAVAAHKRFPDRSDFPMPSPLSADVLDILQRADDYQEYKTKKANAGTLVAELQQAVSLQAPTAEKIQQCRLELAALIKPPKRDRETENELRKLQSEIDKGYALEQLAVPHYIVTHYKLQTEYQNARNALNRKIAALNASLHNQPSDLE